LAGKENRVASASSLGFLKLATAPVKALTRSSPWLNAALWNVQYQLGLWNYLDGGDDSGRELAEMVEQYVPCPSILDLGCGTSANLPLVPGKYGRYHGVDISAKAIKRARMLGRPQATYETADVLTYTTQETYDAILLREVIYYLPADKVRGFLDRLAGFLTPGGVVMIQVWAGERNPGLIAAIEGSSFPVKQERVLERDPDHPTIFVLSNSRSNVPTSADGPERGR
jgi:SAM-dependent methyltransferase